MTWVPKLHGGDDYSRPESAQSRRLRSRRALKSLGVDVDVLDLPNDDEHADDWAELAMLALVTRAPGDDSTGAGRPITETDGP